MSLPRKKSSFAVHSYVQLFLYIQPVPQSYGTVTVGGCPVPKHLTPEALSTVCFYPYFIYFSTLWLCMKCYLLPISSCPWRWRAHFSNHIQYFSGKAIPSDQLRRNSQDSNTALNRYNFTAHCCSTWSDVDRRWSHASGLCPQWQGHGFGRCQGSQILPLFSLFEWRKYPALPARLDLLLWNSQHII